MLEVWALMLAFTIAGGIVTLVYVQNINAGRDADLRALQIAACQRLKHAITDFNGQYGVILRALQTVQGAHPGEPVSAEVIRAFSSPEFHRVDPPRCDRIHIY
jgi:hypothetical protein